jgi:hypothetical protein
MRHCFVPCMSPCYLWCDVLDKAHRVKRAKDDANPNRAGSCDGVSLARRSPEVSGRQKGSVVNRDVVGRPVEGSPSGGAAHKPIESQSNTLRELTRRIQAEYAEMPGLSVTLAQAQRLLASDQQTCRAAFKALIGRGVLRRTAQGRYVRCNP